MGKLCRKLALILLPIVIYFAIFVYFEPYNYFGIKQSDYTADSAIVRVREFTQSPANVIILGDSRFAHVDMDMVEAYVGEPVGQLSFGGASFNECMDILEYAIKTNPDIHTIYCEASFYILNESYYKDRMSQIETIANNPMAYMLNFNYNIEMLNEIKYAIKGEKNVASDYIGDWDESDFYYEDGTPRQFRKNLEEYAQIIYGVCENYSLDYADIDRYIEIAKECKEKGITLYTVLPPLDESLRVLVVDELDIGDDILEFIDLVSPYTTVLNYEYVDDSPYTQRQFYDGFHMDGASGMPVFVEQLFSIDT